MQNRSHGITAGDGAKCVLLVGLGGDQGGADARVETDLLVDGSGIRLEGASMPPFGLAEHRADQAVEQIDGLVGQAGGEIQADGDQRRVPALPLVAGDMLNRGACQPRARVGSGAPDGPGVRGSGSMPIARTCSRRSIRPSMAAGLAASGICRNQVSQIWPAVFPALVSASSRRRCSADRPLVSRRCTSRRAWWRSSAQSRSSARGDGR